MTKIVLFGDSITAGYADDCVTKALTARMEQAFPNCEIINAGIPGNTTVDALERIERNVLKYQPDFVLVFFGANDVATHNEVSAEEYQRNLTKIIGKIGAEKVILVTPPFVNEVLQLDRSLASVHEYAEIVGNLGAEYGCPVIPLLAEMELVESPKIYLQGDGLHFSEKGYDLLAELYTKTLRERGVQG